MKEGDKIKSCIELITGRVIPTRKDWILPPMELNRYGLEWCYYEFPQQNIIIKYSDKYYQFPSFEKMLDFENFLWNLLHRSNIACLEVRNTLMCDNGKTVILVCEQYEYNKNKGPIVQMVPLKPRHPCGRFWHWSYKLLRGVK